MCFVSFRFCFDRGLRSDMFDSIVSMRSSAGFVRFVHSVAPWLLSAVAGRGSGRF